MTNDRVGRMWKLAIVAYFNVLYWHLSGATEKISARIVGF